MTSRRVRIVLQARTTSGRLPAKVLLPVGDIPLAVLCAQRLGSSGREVVLATSDTPSDDLLAATAKKREIRVFRGSSDDVLSRFLDCTSDLADNDLVVRATADNPIPDGPFIEELISAFEHLGTEYLGTSWPTDGLPHGLSAEAFTAGALRKSATDSLDSFDREHVTVQLRRKVGAEGIVPPGLFLSGDYSGLRMTVDTLEDYLTVAEMFRCVVSPESISWRRLIDGLTSPTAGTDSIPGRCEDGSYYSCIMLGTVQFGSNYGIANRYGCPDDAEVRAILCAAAEAGVTHLDTARAYGDAERRIGRLIPKGAADRLHTISKLHPMTDLPDDASVCEVANAVDVSVYGSCRDLNRFRIDVMLFHRSADMRRWGGAAIERLAAHMENGTIGEIGVSVCTPDEAVLNMADRRVTHIQIPFNLLDDRWLATDFQQALAARPGLKVYARSVFLQGLLLSDPVVWPQWATDARTLCDRIQALTRSLNRKSKADLCMAYVRAFPWVTSLVLGVETATQIDELLLLAREPPLMPEEAVTVRKALCGVPERLLNPTLW